MKHLSYIRIYISLFMFFLQLNSVLAQTELSCNSYYEFVDKTIV